MLHGMYPLKSQFILHCAWSRLSDSSWNFTELYQCLSLKPHLCGGHQTKHEKETEKVLCFCELVLCFDLATFGCDML